LEQFTLQVLVNEYHVDAEKIALIHDYFHTLNRTNSGVLSTEDLTPQRFARANMEHAKRKESNFDKLIRPELLAGAGRFRSL